MHGIFLRLKDLFRFIFLTADYEPFEFVGAWLMGISSVVLLNPFTDLYTHGYAYRYVSELVSEQVLGGIMLFVALNKFFALLSGDLRYRMVITSVAALVWAFLFVAFLAADFGVWFPWLTAVYCLISVACAARMRKDLTLNIPPWTHK